MKAMTRNSLLTLAVLTLFGCGREQADNYAANEGATDAAVADPSAVTAEMWLDDFQVGSAAPGAPEGTVAQVRDDFAPGEPVSVSMAVEDAPQGTTVITYWYGPNDRALAYESKEVTGQQQRLGFTQENTHDWQPGQYRAEIWVGDEKVTEQTFEVSSG
jgi:hypothetical protein